jgi:hypothetical protein
VSGRDGPRPGYLVVRADDGAYLGGLMVTDRDGLPLDFRYTDPVTPTRLQRALYGGVLDRYLRGEILLGTLLDALEERPSVLIVDDRDLLADGPDDIPVAFVEATGLDALGAPGARAGDPESGVLVQTPAARSPLRFQPSHADAADAVAEALVTLAERIDPLEPAERVKNALDVIASGGEQG